eukprot:CAMPEP_0175277414 /NCGR_PEP_ID=MMETSP0093-20121207/48994_1 /TAXON_ID=311494 /ORGANISM="Alexandrium monilatum, Strain CCMP3105" /LENGTH=207 /DNA_ID=CAMNT_0016572365 /DNA_START=17 /DNA_END=637 /DNA_ORIENTATION=+
MPNSASRIQFEAVDGWTGCPGSFNGSVFRSDTGERVKLWQVMDVGDGRHFEAEFVLLETAEDAEGSCSQSGRRHPPAPSARTTMPNSASRVQFEVVDGWTGCPSSFNGSVFRSDTGDRVKLRQVMNVGDGRHFEAEAVLLEPAEDAEGSCSQSGRRRPTQPSQKAGLNSATSQNSRRNPHAMSGELRRQSAKGELEIRAGRLLDAEE